MRIDSGAAAGDGSTTAAGAATGVRASAGDGSGTERAGVLRLGAVSAGAALGAGTPAFASVGGTGAFARLLRAVAGASAAFTRGFAAGVRLGFAAGAAGAAVSFDAGAAASSIGGAAADSDALPAFRDVVVRLRGFLTSFATGGFSSGMQ
jgi:hypothetical protein